ATDADFENIIVDDTEITDTSNQINDLLIYTNYFWRVKAVNNEDESSWSEVWNFTTGWFVAQLPAYYTVGPNLNVARVGHKAIGLPDGRFILFGGHGNGFIPLNTAEIWTPSNPNIFSSIVMNNTRDFSALVKLNDGRYLLAGSAYSSGVPAYSHSEIYNPENNTFTTVGNMTRTRMTSSGIALSNDNVLIAGAWYQSNSAIYGDLFDISYQTYSSVGPLSSGRSYPVVMPTNDGNAMVFGGSGVNGGALENSTVEEYNAITSTFTTIRNSLFEDETGWHTSSGGNRSNFEQLMPDGRYLWLAGKTVNNVTYRRLFTFNPETKEIEEFITNPPLPVHSILAVSTQPVIDRIRNTAHFIVRTSTNSNEPPTIKVLSLNLETAELVLSSNSYEFNYYEPFQTIVVLADGRLFLTGGSANNTNFNLVNNTIFITPPLYSNNKQYINLNTGWNTISANFLPDAPNMENIFTEMEELVIVKNADGQIYEPAQNINQIGDWNIAHGYMVYVTAPATLQITGTAVNPSETEINLLSGWNLVSYLRNSPLAISTAFEGINNSIILVKNNMGQLYYPAFGLNTLGNMQQGQ
ncbi:MAG TPA: hypothetical protein PKY56_13690, partial [Candidatus Kapabacteria bacterium]|nr:hypothetical protein [Candidatus Kapabacteria bacterium]